MARQITWRQEDALRHLSRTRPTTTGRLARALGIAHPAAIFLVHRLVAKKLVERRGFVVIDGRRGPRVAKALYLTERGEEVRASPTPLTQAQVAKILGCSQQNVYLIERRGLAKLERRLRRLGFVDGDREVAR